MEIAQVTPMEVISSLPNNKRKINSTTDLLLHSSSPNDHLSKKCCFSTVNSPENSVSPPTTSTSSDQIPASLCSLNQLLKDNSMVVDPKVDENYETEISISINGGFREIEKAEVMETTQTKKKPSPASSGKEEAPPPNMPSAAEIEEFFSVAEKLEQERFADKYNYDIVKDVPLEGKYQWICLKL